MKVGSSGISVVYSNKILPTFRGLSAESSNRAKFLKPKDKQRDVELRRFRKILKVFFGLFFYLGLLFLVPQAQANSIYVLDTAKKEAQFHYLLKELRCLVCQNQDLSDSNASLAKDLRLQVYQMVKAGKSDNEIKDYLTSRYGDFILFKPPVKAVTFLLWVGPFLFLGLGFFIFWRTCFKRESYE
jgi:cytochrome c-type biogenesis protein CcmH